MNSYPNASQGVKSLFTSEILSLVAEVLAIIVAVIGIFAYGSLVGGRSASAVVSAGFAGIFGIAILIIKIVAFIFCIIGLVNAGKDNNTFSTALLMVLISVLFTFINFFAGITLVDYLIKALNFGETFFIVKAVIELVPGNDLEASGAIIIGLAIATLAIGILASLFAGVAFLGFIINLAGFVCTVVFYILYLSFLGRAGKTL